MITLESMSYLIEHDMCNSSVPCMDDVCHGFTAGKQLAARDEESVKFFSPSLII